MSQFPVVCKRNEEKHVFAHYVFPVFLCNLCDSLEPANPVTAGKKKSFILAQNHATHYILQNRLMSVFSVEKRTAELHIKEHTFQPDELL